MTTIKSLLELVGFVLAGALSALVAGGVLIVARVAVSTARRRQAIRIRTQCIEESIPFRVGFRSLLTEEPTEAEESSVDQRTN